MDISRHVKQSSFFERFVECICAVRNVLNDSGTQKWKEHPLKISTDLKIGVHKRDFSSSLKDISL